MVLFGISISMIVFWLVIALIMLIVETLTFLYRFDLPARFYQKDFCGKTANGF